MHLKCGGLRHVTQPPPTAVRPSTLQRAWQPSAAHTSDRNNATFNTRKAPACATTRLHTYQILCVYAPQIARTGALSMGELGHARPLELP